MREFIYYSRTAPTSGKYIGEDLQRSGRIDIAIHTVIASFFLSHKIRTDVKLHLLFAGPPDPSKHLELKPVTEGKTGVDKIYLSKTNIAAIIKKMLHKYHQGKKNEVFPGYWIEKKGFLELAKELNKEGRKMYILDPSGEDIRTLKLDENPIFIFGDHKGLPNKEYNRLKDICIPISLGRRTYFASQALVIVNNELDRREDSKFSPQEELHELENSDNLEK
ncbi:MAG: tRNA (pseudouridine(54)-N(1))-methyltransferase TrmY [Nanoarchaeota archaeon]